MEKPISEDVFYSGINVLEHYKDYEIFLKAENMNNSAKELQKKLETYKASVKVVHCLASMFLTSSDKSTNCSTNYLSLDEVLSDEKSFEILKNTIFFAKEFSSEKDPVIVILHAGSINGCGRTKLPKHNDSALNEMIDKLAELKIDKKVKIAIENVTPYIDYNNTTIKIGMNTGWEKVIWTILIIL